jgi:uncharacterized damage-inducible protein DinB
MVTADYARVMAKYNTWMNERLYGLCADIPDAERKRDAGAFFKSIHGTLNHLLLGDRVWMGRFLAKPFTPKSLAEELYADFDELRRERALTDKAIRQWADALDPRAINGELKYRSIVNPADRTMPMALAIAHFFNHQTHHRGQLTTLLSQRGIDPGVTDLMWIVQQA